MRTLKYCLLVLLVAMCMAGDCEYEVSRYGGGYLPVVYDYYTPVYYDPYPVVYDYGYYGCWDCSGYWW